MSSPWFKSITNCSLSSHKRGLDMGVVGPSRAPPFSWCLGVSSDVDCYNLEPVIGNQCGGHRWYKDSWPICKDSVLLVGPKQQLFSTHRRIKADLIYINQNWYLGQIEYIYHNTVYSNLFCFLCYYNEIISFTTWSIWVMRVHATAKSLEKRGNYAIHSTHTDTCEQNSSRNMCL